MTAEQKKKSREFLDKIHAKYYDKKKAKAQDPKAPGKSPEKPKVAFDKRPTRHELMLQVEAKGVKNFRVINKDELLEILKEGTTQERINEIVTGAVARWKSGWGKKKQKASS